MKAKHVARIAAALFTVIGLLHLLRIIYAVPAVFGSWQVPMWLSAVALLVAGAVAYLGWTAR